MGLLVITVFVIVINARYRNVKAIRQLSEDLTRRVTETVGEKTRVFLTPAARVAETLARMARKGSLPPGDVTDEKPGITVSRPVYGGDGRLFGIFGADIAPSDLSDFLKTLKLGKNGVAFIINDKNEIIAYPDAGRIVKTEKNRFRPVRVGELGDKRIASAFRRIPGTLFVTDLPRRRYGLIIHAVIAQT